MNRALIINVLRFFLLIFLQVFLLKNITVYNLSVPYFYILFILLLPFETNNFVLFLLSFLIGITIDAFYDSPGLHASSCVLLAFVRIIFINLTVHKEGFDNEPEPSLSLMGIRWFFTYVLVLTFAHHFILFTLESFSFSKLPYTLSRLFFSWIFTVFLILLSGFLFFRSKDRK